MVMMVYNNGDGDGDGDDEVMMMLILTMKVLALECGIDLAEEQLHLTDEMTSAWLARNIVTS